MPFTSESAKRLRGPGGRKKGDPVQKAAAIIARDFIEEHIQPVLDTYFKLACGLDASTTRHFIDKVLPDLNGKDPPHVGNTYIQFQFGTQPSGRNGDLGLSQEGQRGDVNGGAIRLIGDEGGGGGNGTDRDSG